MGTGILWQLTVSYLMMVMLICIATMDLIGLQYGNRSRVKMNIMVMLYHSVITEMFWPLVGTDTINPIRIKEGLIYTNLMVVRLGIRKIQYQDLNPIPILGSLSHSICRVRLSPLLHPRLTNPLQIQVLLGHID